MNCNTLFHIKAELLCYGIQVIDESTKELMLQKNAYVFDSGFMHAAHFLIDDTVINTCVSENFCNRSPYSIVAKGDKFELLKKDNYVSDIQVLELPDWCNGYIGDYKIGDYVRPHSKECIACWPYLKCNYYSFGKQCHFCSMGDYRIQTILPESVVGDMVKIALLHDSNYELSLSGGTCHEPDHSILYFSKISDMARQNDAEYISVETAPPTDLYYIDELYKSGATAIIMNLEIANEDLRRQICPGKADISQTQYFRAYERAVKIFGAGNVSCVLMAGIQNPEDIIEKSEELVSMGVIPTIIPFKPLDGCKMREHPITNPVELIHISTEIDKLLSRYKLAASNQKGCTRCNGCSLETIIEKIEEE